MHLNKFASIDDDEAGKIYPLPARRKRNSIASLARPFVRSREAKAVLSLISRFRSFPLRSRQQGLRIKNDQGSLQKLLLVTPTLVWDGLQCQKLYVRGVLESLLRIPVSVRF